MKDIKFFHCADVHLDSPFTSLAVKPGLPRLRRNGLLKAFSQMMDTIKIEKPDLLIIAGDLFENDYSTTSTISKVNGMFGINPDTKVLMISGNHDPEAANSFYRTYDWAENVFFLGDEQDSIYFDDIHTTVYGLGWGAGRAYGSKLDAIHPNTDNYNILLFHGDIDLQIGTRDYNSISSEIVASKGFDYVAAGHNHKTRIYEDIIYNPGSLEPLGFDEPEKHGYFKGSLSKTGGIQVNFIENSVTEYITMELNITGFDSNKKIIDTLLGKIKSQNTLYKILLKGFKTIEFSPDTELISKALLDSTLFAKVRDESSVMIPVEELSLLKGLKGEFARTVVEKLETAEESEKELLIKALYYGLDAIDNGEIEKAGGIEL